MDICMRLIVQYLIMACYFNYVRTDQFLQGYNNIPLVQM